MKNPSSYQKAAVDSGQWLLYRRDPRNGDSDKSELQLDSDSPTIGIEEYLQLEKRFSGLFNSDPGSCNETIAQIQQRIDKRYKKYTSLSGVTDLPTIKNLKLKELDYEPF